MENLTPDEIAKLEQKLENSPLDEDTKNIVKGLIAGQAFLLELVVKLVESSGHLRSKVIQELAKVLGINPKQNGSDNSSNSSNDSSTNREDTETNQNKGEEDPTGEKEEEKAEENNKDTPQKNERSKRSNDDYNPTKSHIHFHENLEPGDQCLACLQGKVYPFREKVIPILIGRSPLAFEEHRLQTLRCNACGEIFEPKLPEDIPKTGHSMPSAQAVLTIMHYQIGVPFASISKFQKMFDQKISVSQLWDAIEHAAKAIKPIYHELNQQSANCYLFYTDDTKARILSHYPENKKNRDKKKRNKDPDDRVATYTSLIIGCTSEGHEIYQYFHGRKYAGENLADLLIQRDLLNGKPIQMKDASTMNAPTNIEVFEAKCNAHAIRKFKDLKSLYPKECEEILKRYVKVSKKDKDLLGERVTARDRLANHKEFSLPLMKEIKSYMKGLIDNKKIEPNSTLGEAIAYFTSHYKELTAFCHIEGAPFDNNKCERGLKMVIRLRKTSMFYKNKHGAEVAGILHSVLYTAQESGVNVLHYLQTIMENQEKVCLDPKSYLPWMYQTNTEVCEEVEEKNSPALV